VLLKPRMDHPEIVERCVAGGEAIFARIDLEESRMIQNEISCTSFRLWKGGSHWSGLPIEKRRSSRVRRIPHGPLEPGLGLEVEHRIVAARVCSRVHLGFCRAAP